MKILGVRYGHDSGAALIIDGDIIANIAEERLTRVKHDVSFPIRSIEFCLGEGGISSQELDCLALPSMAIPEEFFIYFELPDHILSKKKSLMAKVKNILLNGPYVSKSSPVLPLYQKPFKLAQTCKIHLCEHHRAHAASAYYTSGMEKERVLIATLDGRGDDVSVAFWRGESNQISLLKKFDGSGSIAWFYANATEALGWRHGSGEWKVMGLAPYGTARPGALRSFYPEFEHGDLVRPHNYGNFGRWNDHGANHYHGKDAADLEKLVHKLGRENFAAEVQRVAEEQAFKLILPWIEKEAERHLCCAGGFFLNVKFNQKLWYTGKLDSQWIYPDAADSGLPVGVALDAYYAERPHARQRRLHHLYFGPEYSNTYIKKLLDERGLEYRYVDNPVPDTAKFLSQNLVIGWFQDRMEAGPRALGNRSILMSPLRAENKDLINAKVKYREPFRPFCPSMLAEKAKDYLNNPREELFMITSFEVKEEKKGRIPAVVHKDGTARPQMVKKEINPLYYALIEEFSKITGEAAILNTSFNIRGEPIVCHPREAIRCFFDTGLDVLVLGNFIIEKPHLKRSGKKNGIEE